MKEKREVIEIILIITVILNVLLLLFAAVQFAAARELKERCCKLEARVALMVQASVSAESEKEQIADSQAEMKQDLTEAQTEAQTEVQTEAGQEPAAGQTDTGQEDSEEPESEDRASDTIGSGPMEAIQSQYLDAVEASGQKWAVSVENLQTKAVYEHNAGTPFQSASVIKVFIMAAVYDRICYPSSEEKAIWIEEQYDGELKELIEQMITVSDNDAANRLVELLGQGDFQTGAAIVNEYCVQNGYPATSLGRRFLEENPAGDNYTSAADCRKLLSAIYEGTCVTQEASEKMLAVLKQQTRTGKIPAGLLSGMKSANKTGEMPEGYGLGCIENDIAIVFTEKGDYVLCVLSNELDDSNESAQGIITGISTLTANWFMTDGSNGA